jgi:acyl dehydratase
MRTRELASSPRILPLYARTAAPLLPGASRLPWVGGGGSEIPDLRLTLTQVRIDPARVADYGRVCGFPSSEVLPATYPHVLAFPLHLALMADGRFPFGAIGLVHLSNRITQHRPIDPQERLELSVHATPLQDHPRGRTFSLLSQAHVGQELVWEELSTMLHRGSGGEVSRTHDPLEAPSPPLTAEWRLPGDLGRRYAAVSGDRNPIHLHALTARPLGFPRAIAHGMWTKARCLAALEHLPDAFTIDVRFRKPIPLPATVGFGSARSADGVLFGVRDAGKGTGHLEGHVQSADTSGERESAR